MYSQGAFASFSDLDDLSATRRFTNGRGRGRKSAFVRTGASSLDTKSKTATVRNMEQGERKQRFQHSRRPWRDERKRKWGSVPQTVALPPTCTLCRERGHVAENHECKVCRLQGHGEREHKCTRCKELDHTTENHAACDYCLNKEHTYLEHVCERCALKGHDISHHCPVVTCAKLHEMGDHKCGVCGEQGHDLLSKYHCDICKSIDHKGNKHQCNVCKGQGHDTSLCSADVIHCVVVLSGLVQDQAQTIVNLKYRIAKHSKQIHFLRNKTSTRCKKCAGTGLIKTGRGYDSDPEEQLCECKKDGDPGSESDNASIDVPGTRMSATGVQAFVSLLDGRGDGDDDDDGKDSKSE